VPDSAHLGIHRVHPQLLGSAPSASPRCVRGVRPLLVMVRDHLQGNFPRSGSDTPSQSDVFRQPGDHVAFGQLPGLAELNRRSERSRSCRMGSPACATGSSRKPLCATMCSFGFFILKMPIARKRRSRGRRGPLAVASTTWRSHSSWVRPSVNSAPRQPLGDLGAHLVDGAALEHRLDGLAVKMHSPCSGAACGAIRSARSSSCRAAAGPRNARWASNGCRSPRSFRRAVVREELGRAVRSECWLMSAFPA